jgi:ubiquinone/menaquinone biosynthesis C-methylase UbiE
MDDAHRVRATSFGPAAAEYERGRPDYPDDAVDWMIPPGTHAALDLGAGTGKLTRSLAARGLAVTALDPSSEMLAQLSVSSPGVVTAEGRAESIPLTDSSADLATAAQAWHWVEPERAFPEVARVLRPGGTLSLVWNFRDNRTGWMTELARIITDREEAVEVDSSRPHHPMFEEFDYRIFPWSQTVTREELHDLVRSRSIFIVASAEERSRVLAELDLMLDTHPDVAGLAQYDLPYRTHAYRAKVKK